MSCCCREESKKVFYTVSEISRMCGIGIDAVHEEIKGNYLRALRITPRKFVIRVEDFGKWLEEVDKRETHPEKTDDIEEKTP